MMLFLWRGFRKARSLAGGWFTVAMLRSQGATLRGRSRFLSSTYVRYPKAVSIGSNCLIGRDVVIGSEAKGSRLTIGDGVQINDRVQLDHTGDLVFPTTSSSPEIPHASLGQSVAEKQKSTKPDDGQ